MADTDFKFKSHVTEILPNTKAIIQQKEKKALEMKQK
jgi:hypothetical protein